MGVVVEGQAAVVESAAEEGATMEATEVAITKDRAVEKWLVVVADKVAMMHIEQAAPSLEVADQAS